MRRTRFVFVAALVLATFAPSCRLFRKSHKVAPAPAPAPLPAAPVKPPKLPELKVPPSPEVSSTEPDIGRPGPEIQAQPIDQFPPPPRHRTKPRSHENAEEPATAPEPPPAPPLPQLEQILTPEQRQAYLDNIDRNIANAQRTVARLRGRRLNRDQATYLARIQTFIQQANEARQVDLFRAKNLAERASLLADDLMKSVE
jgi:hypothetical protein